jgi:hypothetical protein
VWIFFLPFMPIDFSVRKLVDAVTKGPIRFME